MQGDAMSIPVWLGCGSVLNLQLGLWYLLDLWVWTGFFGTWNRIVFDLVLTEHLWINSFSFQLSAACVWHCLCFHKQYHTGPQWALSDCPMSHMVTWARYWLHVGFGCPDCKLGRVIFPDAPKITLAPRDQLVVDNGFVSFFCKASGNPAPDVYWRKGGKRITTARNQRYMTINMPHGSVLRVEPVKAKKDDSILECVADNGIGEPAVATAKLDVYPEGQCESLLLIMTFSNEGCSLEIVLDGFPFFSIWISLYK